MKFGYHLAFEIEDERLTTSDDDSLRLRWATVKILKFGTPQTIAIIVLKIEKVWCNIALMHPKDADGMANSVDPDQTASSEAVWSWSALFAETYLSQYIEFVR